MVEVSTYEGQVKETWMQKPTVHRDGMEKDSSTELTKVSRVMVVYGAQDVTISRYR